MFFCFHHINCIILKCVINQCFYLHSNVCGKSKNDWKIITHEQLINQFENKLIVLNFLLPSSTKTISTTAFSGISILCVHMQLVPQSAGRLSPLQNCSGLMSSYCERSGAGGDKYEISSIKEMTWSPVGATENEKQKCSNLFHLVLIIECIIRSNFIESINKNVMNSFYYLPKNRLYVFGWKSSSTR